MLFPTGLVCLILGLINTSLYFFPPHITQSLCQVLFITLSSECFSFSLTLKSVLQAEMFHVELPDSFFYANSWISLGCSCRRESARVGFMFRYLDQILFLTSCSSFPHCGNLCCRFPFLTTECETWPFEVAPSATVSKSLHVCAMCRLSLQRLS